MDTVAGQAYRVGLIAERAMAVLAERLHERLAAAAGEPVRMAHLAHAARSEYAKLENP